MGIIINKQQQKKTNPKRFSHHHHRWRCCFYVWLLGRAVAAFAVVCRRSFFGGYALSLSDYPPKLVFCPTY